MTDVSTAKSPLVIDPDADVRVVVHAIVRQMGDVRISGGAFRIKVFHTAGFPWDELFKALLYRDYKVSVTRQKADLFVEASL